MKKSNPNQKNEEKETSYYSFDKDDDVSFPPLISTTTTTTKRPQTISTHHVATQPLLFSQNVIDRQRPSGRLHPKRTLTSSSSSAAAMPPPGYGSFFSTIPLDFTNLNNHFSSSSSSLLPQHLPENGQDDQEDENNDDDEDDENDHDDDEGIVHRCVQVYLKKTQRGKIRQVVRELYLRNDLSCGLQHCTICNLTGIPPGPLSIERDIVVLGVDVIIQQIDFLLDEQVMDNVLLLDTVLKQVNQINRQTYARIRSLCSSNPHLSGQRELREAEDEQEDKHTQRKFHVLFNEFFAPTYVRRKTGETLSSHENRLIRRSLCWLAQHVSDACSVVYLYNQSSQGVPLTAKGVRCTSIYDYVEKDLAERFPQQVVGAKLANLNSADLLAPDDKAHFPPHLTESQLTARIKQNTVVTGRIVMSSYNMASLTVPDSSGEPAMVFSISGWQDINRGVHGDIVVVERKSRSLGQEEQEDEDKKADDENEIQGVEEEELEGITYLKGRVVGILKRNWGEYYGTLKPRDDAYAIEEDSSTFLKTSRLFIPFDNKIPWISIKTRQSHELDSQRICVVIDLWDRYSKRPQGHWVRIMGKTGDRDVESEVILKSHGVITREFSSGVLRCLPPADWEIPAEEVAARLDYRDEIVCSIDPPGCKDIDDALSAKVLENGNYMIGVHIADVTYFVKPGTAIDQEAAERCTTVYLVERRTDMLPSLLTTDLCSLVGGRDRLAFSVFWEVEKASGEIKSADFRKTVIRSSAALTYGQAQLMIDNTNDKSALTCSLRLLASVAKKLRQQRMERGALELASAEVSFELDTETQDPMDVSAYQLRDTNKLVEELMLLANMTVAQHSLLQFPFCSVLRRHPPPKVAALASLKKLLKAAKPSFPDFSYGTSKELSQSLSNFSLKEDPYFNKLIRILTTRCMNQAVYFCTGEMGVASTSLFRHYGLAADLYTHFTSPIRRYADVLVHRVLAASLGIEPLSTWAQNKKEVQEQCVLLNQKHKNAQFAGRASVDFHRFLYFKKQLRPVEVDGVVLRMRKGREGQTIRLRVFVPMYGFEGDVPIETTDYVCEEFHAEPSHSSSSNVSSSTTITASGEDSSLMGSEDSQPIVVKVVSKNDSRVQIQLLDHILIRIEANSENYRHSLRLTYVRKSTAIEITAGKLSPDEMRKQDKELFPDKLEREVN